MPFCNNFGVEMGAYKNRRLRVNGQFCIVQPRYTVMVFMLRLQHNTDWITNFIS